MHFFPFWYIIRYAISLLLYLLLYYILMRTEHKHIIAKLLVCAFLIFGISFWFNKFIVNASFWDIGLNFYDSRIYHIWGTQTDRISGVSHDGSGNTYIAWSFLWSISFSGGYTLTSTGGYDFFVSKLSASWSTLRSTWFWWWGQDFVNTMTTDIHGNVYIAGIYTATLNFPSLWITLSNSGSTDVFVAKMDTDGTLLRAKWWWGTWLDSINAIAVDSNGNVYVAWSIEGNVDFPDLWTVNTVWSSTDIFVFLLTDNWTWVSSIVWWSSATDNAWDIIIQDTVGYVVWSYEGASMDFSWLNWSLTYSGLADSFLASFSTGVDMRLNSTWWWGTWTDVWKKIVLDATGNIYVAWEFDEAFFISWSSILPVGTTDVYIAKFNSLLALEQLISFWSTGIDAIDDFVYNTQEDSSYVAWSFSAELSIGTESITPQGNEDGFLVKFNQNGLDNFTNSIIRTKTFGGTWTDLLKLISFDINNVMYAAWIFNETLSFWYRTLNTTWNYDIFLTKMTLDLDIPIFTWLAANTLISGWWHYSTWVTFTFWDSGLSGAILSWIDISYYSGQFGYGSTITGDGTYIFTVGDYSWNTSSIIFTIDTTYPVFTWLLASGGLVVSWLHYNTTWITLTFWDTHLSWAVLSGLGTSTYFATGVTSGTVVTTGWTYLFTLFDIAGNTTWMIFTIDTTAPVLTGTYPSSWLIITGNSSVTFIWTWIEENLSWYTLYVEQWGTTYLTASTAWTSYTANITNAAGYTWRIVSTDKAWNTWTFSPIPFTMNVPLSGVIALSWVWLQFSWSSAYVSSTFPIYVWSNTTCTYTITWDIATWIRSSGILTWWTIITFYPTASGTDGLKSLYVLLSTGNQSLAKTLTWYLDTSAPSSPTLSSPTSGAITSWAFALGRSSATDTWVWISWYQYFISNTGTFSSIMLSGFTTTTTVNIATGALGATGTFYWKVRSIDKLWRTGESSYWNFYYSGEIFTPTSFSFTNITNARLNRAYLSSTWTITWLSSGTYSLASITKWALYVNGAMTWTSAYVRNGDTVRIELISSDDYDTTITSRLTIGNLTITFRITTMDDDNDVDNDDDITTTLSNTEKLQIASIFLTLRDLYANSSTRISFFNLLLDSLEIKIASLDEDNEQEKIAALQYLYDLIEQYLWDDVDTAFSGGNNWYVAPNGKVYQITYNNTTKLYTSPNFIYPKTFASLDAMKSYIAANNWWSYWWGSFSSTAGRNHTIDQNWQSSPYTAPNGKVYRLFKTTDDRYSSYNFVSAKYFISVDALKNHIYQWNK